MNAQHVFFHLLCLQCLLRPAHGPWLQVMRKFCKANNVVRTDPPMNMPEGRMKGIEGEALVARCLPEGSAGRLSLGEYLLHALMANKRMILWDVLLNSRDIPGVISSPDSASSILDSVLASMDDP